MQEYVQKSMRTTFPRRSAAANGRELSHAVAAPSERNSSSTEVRTAGRVIWCLLLPAGEDGHRHWNGDAPGVEETTPVFPIEARCRDGRVRHPVKRDVVEDLIARQLA